MIAVASNATGTSPSPGVLAFLPSGSLPGPRSPNRDVSTGSPKTTDRGHPGDPLGSLRIACELANPPEPLCMQKRPAPSSGDRDAGAAGGGGAGTIDRCVP